VGDVILRVSGIPLAGLTLRQALDILRTSPSLTLLQVCRVTDPNCASLRSNESPPRTVRSNVVRSYSYGPVSYPSAVHSPVKKLSDPTPTSPLSHQQPPSPPFSVVEMDLSTTVSSISHTSSGDSGEWSPGPDTESETTMDILRPVEATLRNSGSTCGPLQGEFKVTLTKVNGSLGFTLRQLDDTVLKHTVKALVKEPAISDGRLRPGDKLLAANEVELGSLSHGEVVAFLRQAPETCTLTLYRDDSRAQTPLTPETGAAGREKGSLVGSSSLVNMAAWGSAAAGHTKVKQDKRMSQSPSRKHLRYEAAELVRSLQSSRTSLEKAGLGGSVGSLHTHNPHNSSGQTPGTHTLGRRLQARGASPRVPPGQRHHLQQPRVDSPGSPHSLPVGVLATPGTTSSSGSAPPSLLLTTQALSSMDLDSEPCLVIEEIEDYTGGGGGSPGQPHLTSLPQSPCVTSPGSGSAISPCIGNYFYQEQENKTKSLPRGRSTNPFFQGDFQNIERVERPNDLNLNGQSRKQAFMFNNNWNANQF